MICSYLQIPERFVCLILKDGFCVMHIPFVCSLIYLAFCLDMAHEQINGAPNETHSCRFASLAY